MFIYDKEFHEVMIEWKSGERKEPYFFRKKPITCQLHPKDEDVIMRAYFKGSMPVWIEKFAKQKGYRTREVTGEYGKGFWISNIQQNNGIILCPFTKGAIDEWFEKLDEEFLPYKDKLMEYLDIVDVNLKYYSELYNEYGIYYRRESIIKENGMLYLQANLFPKRDQEGNPSVQNYWDEFPEIIQKMTEPRIIPEEALQANIIEEEENEFVLDLNLEEAVSSDESYKDIDAAIDDEPLINIDETGYINEPVVEAIIDEPVEEIQLLEEEAIIDEPAEEIQLLEEDSIIDELAEEIHLLEEETVIKEAVNEISIEEMSPLELLDSIEKESAGPPKVAIKTRKKEGIIEGQFLLF